MDVRLPKELDSISNVPERPVCCLPIALLVRRISAHPSQALDFVSPHRDLDPVAGASADLLSHPVFCNPAASPFTVSSRSRRQSSPPPVRTRVSAASCNCDRAST